MLDACGEMMTLCMLEAATWAVSISLSTSHQS